MGVSEEHPGVFMIRDNCHLRDFQSNFNANSVSVALNKWLKPQVPDGCVIHSFRHSLRDRLRAIERPADIINAIGGWVTEGVGHQYGKGHRLTVMHGWMRRLRNGDQES